MAALQDIKRRIRSVRSTRQITKAMQLVAASKLRKYADAASAPRRYREVATELLARLAGEAASIDHPLYRERPVKNALVIVIAGDRTLAGPSNALVMRAYGRRAMELGFTPQVIAVGRQAELQIARRDDANELAGYDLESGDGDVEVARPITQQIVQLFSDAAIDRVDLIYTDFVSSVTQKVTSEQLLPAVAPASVTPSSSTETPTLEPDLETVVEVATRSLIEARVETAILSARASEQAARMIAMMNASDNAADLIDSYTLEYNNARQAAITQELAEISGGAEAMT